MAEWFFLRNVQHVLLKEDPGVEDTSPQALVEGLDFEKIKNDFGVLGASLNGPKIWLPEREFDGIAMAWVAQLNLGNSVTISEGMRPYKPATIRSGSWFESRRSPQ